MRVRNDDCVSWATLREAKGLPSALRSSKIQLLIQWDSNRRPTRKFKLLSFMMVSLRTNALLPFHRSVTSMCAAKSQQCYALGYTLSYAS